MYLYIGNKNYSSWSLRAWLMLDKHGIDFNEHVLELDTPSFYEALKGIGPSMRVPTLIDDGLTVWDSLAICEYINDAYLNGSAWPKNIQERAKARAITAEMHSGFNDLRNEMPMNIRAKRKLDFSKGASKDIARISQIWSEQYKQHKGWLFGDWTIADAMFAPVVHRFNTYGVAVDSDARGYMDQALACESMQRWVEAALQESSILVQEEVGEPL